MVIRRTTVFGIALAMLVFLFAAASAPGTASAAQCKGADAAPQKLRKREARKVMLCLINKERRDHGLGSLDRQHEQTKAARKHTRRMIREHCFSHECPGEKDLTGRLVHSDYLPCGCTWGIAENLAYGEQTLGSPRKIFKAWMNSPEHRINILNGGYKQIGIGIVWGTPSVGRDRGSATYTTDFGFRR